MNNKFFRKFFYILSTGALVSIIGLITGIIQARTLGPELRGDLAHYLLFINSAILILNFGVTEYSLRKGIDNKSFDIHALLLFFTIVSPLSLAIAFFIDINNAFLLVICVLILPVSILNNCVINYLNGNGEIFYFNLFRLLQPFFYLVLIVSTYLGLGQVAIEYFIAFLFISNFITFSFSFYTFFAIEKAKNTKKDNGNKKRNNYIKFSIVTIANVYETIKSSFLYYKRSIVLALSSQAERYLAILILIPKELGVYVVNFTLVNTVLSILSSSLFSAKLNAILTIDLSIKNLYRFILLCTSVLFASSIVISLLSEKIISILFGFDYLLTNDQVLLLSILVSLILLKELVNKIRLHIDHLKKIIITETLFLVMCYIFYYHHLTPSFENFLKSMIVFLTMSFLLCLSSLTIKIKGGF